MSSVGFSDLKKTLLYDLRELCCPSSRVKQPAADRNGLLEHFLELNLVRVRRGRQLRTAKFLC
jgi:hypothetical protein